MDERLEQMQHDFIELHNHTADQLVFGANSGICLAAVYFSPKEKLAEKPMRTFFKAVQDAMTISEEINHG